LRVILISIFTSGRGESDPVELNKSNLVGAWIYSDGAKPNAHDRLVGLAVRVYENGQQFAEFANPSTLLREKRE